MGHFPEKNGRFKAVYKLHTKNVQCLTQYTIQNINEEYVEYGRDLRRHRTEQKISVVNHNARIRVSDTLTRGRGGVYRALNLSVCHPYAYCVTQMH